jgi:hypothetical protein
MPKITQIQYDNITKRVLVYIDYRICTSMDQKTWHNLDLNEGSEISCQQLRQRKILAEKIPAEANFTNISSLAITRTARWLNKNLSNIEARIIDFRYGRNDGGLSLNYPNTRNDQNISLVLKETNTEIITLEVSAVEMQCGINYWLREDKLRYAQNQSKRDGWVMLYYQYPKETFIWIKPEKDKQYVSEILSKNSPSRFVPFNNRSFEIYSDKEFCEYVQKKIEQLVTKTSSDRNTKFTGPDSLDKNT